MKTKLFTIFIFTIFLITNIFAQQKKEIGQLSGGIETTNQYYKKDSATNALVPQDKIGSNSYLKLDYNFKNFTAGVQLETYLPLLLGYPGNMDGSKLTNKYFTYRTQNLEATVGDFYEQFGNGLLFRSFENRQIGINNALEGLNIRFQPEKFLDVKIIYGKQRKFYDYSKGVIRGADVTMDWTVTNENKNTKGKFTTGLGIINRYDPYLGSNPNINPTTNAWSARANYDAENFYINIENITKEKDAHFSNNFYTIKGNALQINTGITKNNLGTNLTLRRLSNMDFRTDRNAIQAEYLVNFVPALTRQHDYALSNIYVYNAQANGEIGGQFDLQYKWKKGTKLGGKYGTNLSMNYSNYNALDITSITANGYSANYFSVGNEKYFSDLNVEVKKKLTTKTTGTFFFQNIFYNKSKIEGGLYPNIKAQIAAVDFLFKLPLKKSLHTELMHLNTQQDHKNWIGSLWELGMAPKWTWFVQNMYNYGNPTKKVNYFTFGTSYTYNTTRLLLSYGRQRQGLVCVGGVCRMVPAYSGLSATLTTNF